MFVNMAFVNPYQGKERELAENMLSFAKALRDQPGLIRTFVLSESDGKTLVGVSMWSDEAAFQHGMANAKPTPPKYPTETLRKDPPIVRQFKEV